MHRCVISSTEKNHNGKEDKVDWFTWATRAKYYRPGDLNRFHIGQYGTVSQR